MLKRIISLITAISMVTLYFPMSDFILDQNKTDCISAVAANIQSTDDHAEWSKNGRKSNAVWDISEEEIEAKNGEKARVELTVTVENADVAINGFQAEFKLDAKAQADKVISVAAKQGAAYNWIVLGPMNADFMKGQMIFNGFADNLKNYIPKSSDVFYITFEIPEVENIDWSHAQTDDSGRKYVVYGVDWADLQLVNSGIDDKTDEYCVYPSEMLPGEIKVYAPSSISTTTTSAAPSSTTNTTSLTTTTTTTQQTTTIPLSTTTASSTSQPSNNIVSSGTCGNNLTWTLDDGGSLIISGTGSIADKAFYNCKNITSVTIPDSVTSIGNSAFEGCWGLTFVVIPHSVTDVGVRAFASCMNLTAVGIMNPKCILSDSKSAFLSNDFNGTIYGYEESTAQTYAKEHGFRFEVVSNSTSDPTSFLKKYEYKIEIGDGNLYCYSNDTRSFTELCRNDIRFMCREKDKSIGAEAEWEQLPVSDLKDLHIMTAEGQYDSPSKAAYMSTGGFSTGLPLAARFEYNGSPFLMNPQYGFTAYAVIGKKGDVNLDDRCNSSDAYKVLLYAAAVGINKQDDFPLAGFTDNALQDLALFLADTDSETEITCSEKMNSRNLNALDAAWILQYAYDAGLTTDGIVDYLGESHPEKVTTKSGNVGIEIVPDTVIVGQPITVHVELSKNDGFNAVEFGLRVNAASYKVIPNSNSSMDFIYQDDGNGLIWFTWATVNAHKNTFRICDIQIPYESIQSDSASWSPVQYKSESNGKKSFWAVVDAKNATDTFLDEEVTCVPVNLTANDISGKCNNGLVWTLDENGTLTITGTGEINEVPWDEYWEDVTSVVIGEGVTSICDSAFEWYKNLKSVTLPNTLQSIGILAFNGSGLTSVMIPANVNSIGWGAFYNCDDLESIDVSVSNTTYKAIDGILFSKNMDELLQFPAGKNQQNYQVPDSVDYIGMYAFGCCNHLSNVTVSDTVTYIADYAFSDCENLTSFNITKNVDTIGWGVFAGCTKLPSISVASDNPYYCDQNGVVFTNDMTVLVQYPAGKTGLSYTVPNSVSIVGGSAFNSCINLQSVVIPDSVRNINRNAFFYCENLSSITFQSPFCLIDENESTICNGYDDNDNIYFSGIIKGYTNSGAHIYAQKNGYQFQALSNSPVTLPVTGKCGDQLNWKLDGTGTLTVSGTGDMTSSPWLEDYQMDIQAVVIENGVTSIQYDSFSGCRNMFSLELSDTVTHIGENAFNQCVSLEAVSIPAKTTYIGEAAFADCWALSAFEVDTNNPEFISVDGVLYTKDMTILHQYPAGKEGTSYIIPDTVKRISAQAFTNASLEAVKIPDSVVFIGMNAFLYCTYLKTVNIPKGLGIITEGTFSNCVSLENISIPDNVIRIGMFAFEECDSLTRITIPKSVEQIYERAFLNCSNLTAIEVADGNPEYVSVDGVLFTKDQSELLVYPCAKSGTSYSVPTTVKTIGDCAFSECNNLTSLILPANVQIIDRFAITDCQNVTSIYFYNAQCSFNDEDNVPISNGTDDDGYAYYNGTIYGAANSTAQTFANEYGYKFALLSAAPVIQPTTKDESLGDVNDDGSINAKDANAILIAAARLGTGNTSGLSAELEKAADVNGDGIINAKDASIILRYAAAVGTGQKVSLEDFA